MNPQAAAAKKVKRKPVHVYMRVDNDGRLYCADDVSRSELRRRKIRRGELVRIEIKRNRDYGQHKKAHELGKLIAQNIEEFGRFEETKDWHGALKHLQKLSGVECEPFEFEIPGIGKFTGNVPASLCFEEMDECRFQKAYADFCAYLKRRWWPQLDEAQIEQMASLVGDAS